MRRPFCKLAVVILFALVVMNGTLLVKWLRCSDEGIQDVAKSQADERTATRLQSEATVDVEPSSFEAIPQGVEGISRWDSTRQYQIHDFYWVGAGFKRTALNLGVCLATQSSLDRLYWVSHVAQQWRGAMSVSVFLEDDQIEYFRKVLHHLQRCHADLLDSIAFHVVTGRPTDTSRQPPLGFKEPLNCTTAVQDMERMLKDRSELARKWMVEGKAYPQNLMRNVARKDCPTDHILLLDVDVIPSFNMAQEIAQFLDQSSVADCLKCAFVVPTYELDITAPLPANKSQLLLLENQGRAQPFHLKAFRFNQFASNLTRWRQTSETDQVIISHNVTNYEFFYEPFYVSRDNTPPHDERFIGYGFTRNTQVYEMTLAGWTFHVLSPIFTIHLGLLTKQKKPAWRRNQMEINRRLFDAFIHTEMKARYGQRSPIKWHAKPASTVNKQPNAKKIPN